MTPYQQENYQRASDVWGHAYIHREDGHWLVVYQGECPMDWEWEEAQTTIQHLQHQFCDVQSLNQNLHDELAHARTQIWELETLTRPTSLTLVAPHGWGLGQGLLGCGRSEGRGTPPPGFSPL